MQGLDGQCLYFVSGWWSYSFCYGSEVVQFHALPTPVNGAPAKDPASQDYVLGRVPQPQPGSGQKPGGQKHQTQEVLKTEPTTPPNTELLVKGDQRYLVQRLQGGTVCDLTNRERTIEIQYHCNPGGSTDRIAWIKEVTTCTYLMEIRTPRLCEDVAFLPPKPMKAHPISCQLIVSSEEEAARWTKQQTLEAYEKMGGGANVNAGIAIKADKGSASTQGHAQKDYRGKTIGGVVIGGRRVLGSGEDGQPAPQLSPPRSFIAGRFPRQGGGPQIEVLASAKSKADGGKVDVLTAEQLEKLQLDPERVEALRKELEKIAGDKAWKLEVVEIPGGDAEIRGIVDSDEEEWEELAKGKGKGASSGSKSDGKKKEQRQDDDEGSEEVFFKEEL
jgi:protein OS-9